VYGAADDEELGPDPAPAWERLDRAAAAAATALDGWRRRAREAEAEVARLRRELEELTTLGPLPSTEAGDELRRLRAENAVLVSRTDEARKRITGLLAKLAVLEARR
jgi:uncharacterized membrane protein